MLAKGWVVREGGLGKIAHESADSRFLLAPELALITTSLRGRVATDEGDDGAGGGKEEGGRGGKKERKRFNGAQGREAECDPPSADH